jgi:aryl-alcohol dehydrogenase-like predicted oxidoreductase
VDKSQAEALAVPRVELAPGYSVSRVINGCWQLSKGHGGNHDTEKQLFRRLAQLVDAGFTTFDCADIYTGVERLLGRFLGQLENHRCVQIHTKFVPDIAALPSLDRPGVESIIHRSLSRLGVECLDLVQFHWWDYAVPGYLEALRVLDDLRLAGKIRFLGLTNFDCKHVSELVGTGIPVTSLQLQYSLLDRRPDKGMTRLAKRQGIKLLAYGALSGGLLSDKQSLSPPAKGDNRSLQKYRLMIEEAGGWPAFRALQLVLHEIALEHGVSSASIAAHWVLARPSVAAVILGVGSRAHIDENSMLNNLEVSEDEQRRIGLALSGLRVPRGDVFELEREPLGPHAVGMKMNLNAGASIE